MTSIPEDTYTPETQNRDSKVSVLMITDTPNEDLEFFYPYYRFLGEGFRVDVATPHGGSFSGEKGFSLPASKKISEVQAKDYDFLFLPGGLAPEHLKKDAQVLAITKEFHRDGKIIGAICHGPQILAGAGIISGRKISAWPEVEQEVTDAGGKYVNMEAVADGNLVTARWPGDLPAHVRLTLETFRASSLYKKAV